jgi:hypothetical protein
MLFPCKNTAKEPKGLYISCTAISPSSKEELWVYFNEQFFILSTPPLRLVDEWFGTKSLH